MTIGITTIVSCATPTSAYRTLPGIRTNMRTTSLERFVSPDGNAAVSSRTNPSSESLSTRRATSTG